MLWYADAGRHARSGDEREPDAGRGGRDGAAGSAMGRACRPEPGIPAVVALAGALGYAGTAMWSDELGGCPGFPLGRVVASNGGGAAHYTSAGGPSAAAPARAGLASFAMTVTKMPGGHLVEVYGAPVPKRSRASPTGSRGVRPVEAPRHGLGRLTAALGRDRDFSTAPARRVGADRGDIHRDRESRTRRRQVPAGQAGDGRRHGRVHQSGGRGPGLAARVPAVPGSSGATGGRPDATPSGVTNAEGQEWHRLKPAVRCHHEASPLRRPGGRPGGAACR